MKTIADRNEIEAATPENVYRVSIHNQIYSTTYYVVTGWTRAEKGGWKPNGYRYGYRGKGGALGLTGGEAIELASKLNREEGWEPGMKVLNSKGGEAFRLHVLRGEECQCGKINCEIGHDR